MAGVIKAHDRGRPPSGVPFNFEDLARRADGYLGTVREQAAQVVAKAYEDAKRIREQARVEGRQAAEQEMDALLEQKISREMQTLVPALRAAIDQIQQARPTWLAEWEHQVVHLAAAIARLVIRRELTSRPEITLNLIREALAHCTGQAGVRLALSQKDHESLRGQVDVLTSELCRLAPAEITVDPQMSPGGCRVETQFGSIDQSIEAQLQRIEEELS